MAFVVTDLASALRLGVNIDHVATVRNARGGHHPDPVRAAHAAVHAGAHGITAHLREDRRHIRDDDVARLKAELTVPLNFEMAATPEMVAIALKTRPNACCLVPERRQERTTEGGLDVSPSNADLAGHIQSLKAAGIRVSLFIEPSLEAVDAATRLQADIVEFHTGRYCEAALANDAAAQASELQRIQRAALACHQRGLEPHAGHGLTYLTVQPIAAIPSMRELNIGHFLMGEALFVGIEAAIKRMLILMAEARA